jgi:hypothetical protein
MKERARVSKKLTIKLQNHLIIVKKVKIRSFVSLNAKQLAKHTNITTIYRAN